MNHNKPQETITKVGGITEENAAQYQTFFDNFRTIAMGGNPNI